MSSLNKLMKRGGGGGGGTNFPVRNAIIIALDIDHESNRSLSHTITQ